MRRRPSLIVVIGLLLSLLACGQPVEQVQRAALEPTATALPPTATATATATAVPIPTVTPLPPTPTATAPATATATPRPPTATPRPPAPTVAPTRAPTATTRAQPPTPFGTRPSGWKTYTGTVLPFTLYYPPNWSVDESKLSDGYVIFLQPGEYRAVLVGTTGVRTNASADQLRDEYFNEVLADCTKKGIDVTRDNTFSNIVFKSVGATCNQPNDPDLYYFYIGLGLANNVPWRFRFYSLYEEYNQNVEDYFFPIISSLNIYANP
jgi:hypothetical protein